MRYITPIILLIISVLSFFMFTNPTYNDIKTLKVVSASYNDALNNAQELKSKRDILNDKYNKMSPDDLKRLTQLLPDSADNIRLIIDLQHMAQAYGMTINSTKFDAKSAIKSVTPTPTSPLASASANDVTQATRDYGTFDLVFSTTGTYENFLKFLKDIESSLRLTDVESIDFDSSQAVVPLGVAGTAPVGLGGGAVSSGTVPVGGYVYTIKLRTYWLKG